MSRRDYSDHYDPDMTAAEFYGWPTRAEAERDMAEPMTGPVSDCRGCGICLGCVLAKMSRRGNCPTPECWGDERYAAPGRGHADHCHYPLSDVTP